jgi:predicted dehydrogenase|tara:strand:+ start:31 stop:948 length:918 start_codon:yes stop_codon:yes gene_type:complete
MKIGIIGSGGHSKRIQKILQKKQLNFFIYKPEKPNYFDKKNFEDLKKCKVIFIISPNNTHYDYIKKLYKGRYIFCEKPPVNNKKDLLGLKKLKTKKIYFNYNFRFMKIAEIIMKKNQYGLKNLVYANLSTSHGLAQKKNYKKNWRSNLKKCPKGVFEIVSIHYIDLINYLFDVSKIGKPKLVNLSRAGNSYDTSLVEMKLKNDALVNIFSTYNSSYAKNLFFLFENGIIEQRDNIIKIRGPSLNLDKKGFFKPPKIIKIIKINENKDYTNSLYDSVTFFLKYVKNKKMFNKKILDISIKSNSLIV